MPFAVTARAVEIVDRVGICHDISLRVGHGKMRRVHWLGARDLSVADILAGRGFVPVDRIAAFFGVFLIDQGGNGYASQNQGRP